VLGVKQPQGEHRETDAIDPEKTCGAWNFRHRVPVRSIASVCLYRRVGNGLVTTG
jgi:hypothetical protein